MLPANLFAGRFGFQRPEERSMFRSIRSVLSSSAIFLIGLALLLVPTAARAAANSGTVRGKLTDWVFRLIVIAD